MKQVFMKKGNVFVGDVPAPTVSLGRVIVKVSASLISTGTEAASLANTKESLVKKIIKKP